MYFSLNKPTSSGFKILEKKNTYLPKNIKTKTSTPNDLNNKGRMQGYISSMCVCLCVCPRWISETAAPTNIKFGQLTRVMILTKMKY